MILFTLSLYFFFLIRSLFVSSRYVYSSSLLLFSLKFSRKKSCVLLFSFADFSKKDVPFSCSILFHWKKHCCEQLLLFIVFSVFFWKTFWKNLPYFLWKNSSFFHHFLFLFITLRIHLCFSFPFLLNLWVFLDLLLLELLFLLLHFLQFSLNNNNFSFLLLFFFFWKNFLNIHFTCMGCLLMSFCSNTSPNHKKLVCSFPFFLVHFFMSICICMFVLLFAIFPSFVLFFCVFKHFSFLFSFLNVFLCWSLLLISFFENSVWFEHRFSHLLKISPFTYSPFFTKKMCFFLNCSFCAVSFFRKKLFLICWSSKESNVPLWFLFLLVVCFFLEETCKISCFYLFLNLLFLKHVFFCFIFLDILRNMVPSKMSVSPFHVLLLFIIFTSVLSLFVSLLVFSFRSPFSPLVHFVGLFIISVFLDVKFYAKKMYLFELLQNSLFLSSLFHQNLSFLCFLFLLGLSQTNICFHVLFFCLLKKWFLIFV